ncbi:DgyrCDS14775 [Dimorphilus gyrociliatus]|uniref:DgyrCDS14775 n=1 Tax=Dimorphilus gyrociliatus TaxID=2664684 RepID=A0A7I8WEY5_9ANNE|nr:DgyrCDS14775 [Dimorphilus gyrociliatus]
MYIEDIIYSFNFCKYNPIGIHDEHKFPNSSFSAHGTYSSHKPEYARIEETTGINWHTLDYTNGWVMVSAMIFMD